MSILEKTFGTTINEKGYKVLNPKVRLLQGDGVDAEAIEMILNAMQKNKWSADNIVFGMGGGLLQKMNRDTLKFAFKCSYAEIDGKGKDIFKDPITDSGKKSKRGQLKLIENEIENYQTVRKESKGIDLLETVFENGKILKEYGFEEVKRNAEYLV